MKETLRKTLDRVRGWELGLMYLLVFGLVSFGVFNYSGGKYTVHLLLVLGSFLLVFTVLNQSLRSRTHRLLSTIKFSETLKRIGILSMIGLTLSTILAHFLYLKDLPLLLQWQETDIIEAALVRQGITEGIPGLLGYAMSFVVKAFLPFLLVYTLHTKRTRLFWIILVIGLFYLVNLLQKSYMVLFFLPMIIYLVTSRKWLYAGISMITMVGLIFFLVYASNPALRGHAQKERDMSGVAQSSRGLLDRTLYMPGRVVTVWFESIPEEFPYQKGCGYKFIAPIKGCAYTDYAKKMYVKIYPQYAEQGLQGTANGASFIYDYANFGKGGLILGGALLAIVLFLAQVVFYDNRRMLLTLNLMPVLLLSSSSLTSLFVSGGWGMILVLAHIYRKELS